MLYLGFVYYVHARAGCFVQFSFFFFFCKNQRYTFYITEQINTISLADYKILKGGKNKIKRRKIVRLRRKVIKAQNLYDENKW
jgi:hypothetical protein